MAPEQPDHYYILPNPATNVSCRDLAQAAWQNYTQEPRRQDEPVLASWRELGSPVAGRFVPERIFVFDRNPAMISSL